MKKPSSTPLIITLLIIVAIIAGAVFTKPYWQDYFAAKQEIGIAPVVPETKEPPVEKKLSITEQGALVLEALKNKDDKKLASYVHPEFGIRLSPSGHIDIDNHQRFDAEQVGMASTDTKVYTWGFADGSGEPMDMTFPAYWDRWIYDKDFAKAPEVSNTKILGTGNIINNQWEVYPMASIVEYHFPGFDPQYGGMDWESLRLVFQQKDGTWYLVGIIHDQWSI